MKCEVCGKEIEGITAHYQTKKICQKCWRKRKYNPSDNNWYNYNN